MRHAKHTFKIGRTGSHRRALIANLLKSLIIHGRVETTLAKAKELRRHADHMVTLGKEASLHARRQVTAKLGIRYNTLTRKEQKQAKEGNTKAYNADRKVLPILFDELAKKYQDRQGGYTRIIRIGARVGDAAEMVLIEYI